MAEPDIQHDLTPEEERLAESYFCRKWGEPPVTEEMNPNISSRQGLHDELDAVDAALKAAYAAVPRDETFTARVMNVLPSAAGVPATPGTATGMQVMVGRRARRTWVWGVAGVAAALLFLAACLWWPALYGAPGGSAKVAKGLVLDAAGREAKELVPGQTYQVAGAEAVIRVGQDATVRLLETSRFEVPAVQVSGVRLHDGWAYAQSSERDALRVEGDDLTADVQGVSLVVQSTPEAVEYGEGMVLVFKGDALVHLPQVEDGVVLREGQVFTVALGTHVVESFLERAEETVKELEQLPADPAQLRLWRKQYVQVVAGYQRELASFAKELASTRDVVRRAELRRRQVLVEQYLAQHKQRLQAMPELSENETPQERAGRVQRAVKRIERGRKEFSDPRQWL